MSPVPVLTAFAGVGLVLVTGLAWQEAADWEVWAAIVTFWFLFVHVIRSR